MYHHTVLLEIADGFDGPIREEFDWLASEIGLGAGVIEYGLVRNEAPSRGVFGHVLFSRFQDRQAFERYDRGEGHARLKAFLAPFVRSLVVADGESRHG